jgi:hypothetical protein
VLAAEVNFKILQSKVVESSSKKFKNEFFNKG